MTLSPLILPNNEFLYVDSNTQRVLPFDTTKLIRFANNQVLVDLRYVIQKNHYIDGLDIIEDQMAISYRGQELWFYAPDGNNVKLPALVSWIETLQQAFDIPHHKIFFVSVIPSLSKWQWIPYPLEAFENVIVALQNYQISKVTSATKFVGFLANSRPSIERFRMSYILGKLFGDDCYLTLNKDAVASLLEFAGCAEKYVDELQWLAQHQFYNDKNHLGIINYRMGLRNYTRIWSQWLIEVVSETDSYQNQWFTDKIAKCLITGKPFLLLSGQHSLRNLRNMGFVTFDKWIDESYDQCVLPSQRIRAIGQSLQTLYCDSNRPAIIEEMYYHAEKNKQLAIDYVQQKIQLRANS